MAGRGRGGGGLKYPRGTEGGRLGERRDAYFLMELRREKGKYRDRDRKIGRNREIGKIWGVDLLLELKEREGGG